MSEKNAAIRSPRTRGPGIVVAALVAVALFAGWQWTARAYDLKRGSSSDGTGGVEHVVMLLEPTMPCCLPEHGAPFSPVELPVGKELTLFLTIRPVAQQPCTLARVGHMRVRFSVLGIDREQRMPLDPVAVFDNTGPDRGGVTYTVSEP